MRAVQTRRRCNVDAGSGRRARPYSTLLSRRPFSGTLSGLLSLTLLPLPRRLIVLQFPPLNRYDCLAINPYPPPPFSFLSSAFAPRFSLDICVRILVSRFYLISPVHKRDIYLSVSLNVLRGIIIWLIKSFCTYICVISLNSRIMIHIRYIIVSL